jgi:hypothetical protein
VNLERSYTQKQLRNYLFDYSVKLGKPPADFRGDYAVGQEDQVHRGLMVIKTSNKTKAKQRKGALLNWKVNLETSFPLFQFGFTDFYFDCGRMVRTSDSQPEGHGEGMAWYL